MDQCLSSRVCEEGPDLCNIAKAVENGFDDLAEMRFEGAGGIKDHTKVACLEGRRDSSAIYGESGVVDSAEGGRGANVEEFCSVSVEFEEIELQPVFYCKQARVNVREGWVVGGFGVYRYI